MSLTGKFWGRVVCLQGWLGCNNFNSESRPIKQGRRWRPRTDPPKGWNGRLPGQCVLWLMDRSRTLSEYALECCPVKRHCIDIASSVSLEFAEFLKSTRIIVHGPFVGRQPNQAPAHDSERIPSTISDMLNTAIAMHLKEAKFRSRNANLLCLGYRLNQDGGKCGTLTHDLSIENHYPNTLLNHFGEDSQWPKLLDVAGGHFLMHLLKNTSIFVFLSTSGSRKDFLQIAGPPLSESHSPGWNSLTKKYNKVLPRYRIFYGRPNSLADEKVVHGFPFRSPWNKIKTAKNEKFPQLFDHFFPSAKGKEVALAQRSLYYMLKKVKKIHFRHLIDYYCPDPLDPIKLLSATELGGFGVFPRIENKENFNGNILELCCPYDRVSAFINAVLVRLLPERLTKCAAFGQFLETIHVFIRLRRYENMSQSELLKGVSLSEFWKALMFKAAPASNAAESRHRSLVVSSFLVASLTEVVIPLLSCNFYCTETATNRNKVIYFRQDVWRRMTSLAWPFFQRTMLKPEAPCVIGTSWSNYGHCKVRLIPKERTFRPIMNMKRPLSRRTGTKASINGMLRSLHAVLDYHRKYEPEKMGFSVMCMNEVLERLRSYKLSLPPSVGRQKLYFVKMDVKACFDSIPHELLLQVMRLVIDKDDYVIHKYDIVKRDADGKPRNTFKVLAFPSSSISDVKSLQRRHRFSDSPGAIIADKVLGRKLERRKLLNMLDEHINHTMTRIGKNWFRLRKGIPQGSVLSTILCSFFYARLDHDHLDGFAESGNSLLMRYVDDILYITSDLQKANEILRVSLLGFPNYGVVINREKVFCNFENAHEIPRPPESTTMFQWCGLAINVDDLSILGDYTRFFGFPISDSLSLDRVGNPVKSLRNHLRTFLLPKLHPIFLDDVLNDDWTTVAINVFRNAILVGMKLHCMIKEFEEHKLASFRDEIIFDLLQTASTEAEVKVRAKCRHAMIQGTHLVRQLLIRGFYEVLRRRPTRYQNCLLPALKGICIAQAISVLYGHDLEETLLQSAFPLLENILF